MKRRPVVGETLYSLNVGNAARYTPQVLTPVVVVRVGNKYFYCCRPEDIKAERSHKKYTLSTWQQESGGYGASSALYETEQERLDEKEGNQLRDKIAEQFRYAFNAQKVTLDQLRRINAILEEK